MVNVVEVLWYKCKPYAFPAFMLCFAVFLGLIGTDKPLYTAALIPLVLYVLCLFTRPMVACFIMILVIIDFYGFTTEDFLNLPGAFKLRDLCLFSLLSIVGLNIAIDRKTILQVRSPLNKYIVFMLVFILFVIFYTVLEFGVSFASSLRLSRKYLLYLSFFVVMYVIRDESDLRKFLKIFFIMGTVAAILMIVQFILGPNHVILPTVRVEYQQLGGFYIPRIYFRGCIPLIAFSASIAFWVFQTQKRQKLYLLLAVLTQLAWFLGFSRANWIKQLCVIIVPFVFASGIIKKKIVSFFIISFLILFVIIIGAQLSGYDFVPFFLNMWERIQSAYSDLMQGAGTVASRLEDSAIRIKYFLDRPWFGVGFLHYVAASESIKAVIVKDLYIETSDSGLMTLLVTMGLVGAGVFSILTIAFLKHCVRIYRETQSPYLRGIVLGCFGYFSGGVISFITLPFFTYPYEIPFIAIAFALVEKINQFNHNTKHDMLLLKNGQTSPITTRRHAKKI